MTPKELSEIKDRLGDWLSGLNALGSDAHRVDRTRANDLFKLVQAIEKIRDEELQYGERSPDGTQRLCDVLYGKDVVGKWIGGSNAVMLHDAADLIASLRQKNEEKFRSALERIVAWEDGQSLKIARETLGIHPEDFVLKRKEFQKKYPLS